jgi:hypothetical protein
MIGSVVRDAVPGFKLSEKLSGWPESSILYVFQALTDAFLGIGSRGNVEQALISLGVLHDSRGLPVHRKHHGTLALLEMFHKVTIRCFIYTAIPAC